MVQYTYGCVYIFDLEKCCLFWKLYWLFVFLQESMSCLKYSDFNRRLCNKLNKRQKNVSFAFQIYIIHYINIVFSESALFKPYCEQYERFFVDIVKLSRVYFKFQIFYRYHRYRYFSKC